MTATIRLATVADATSIQRIYRAGGRARSDVVRDRGPDGRGFAQRIAHDALANAVARLRRGGRGARIRVRQPASRPRGVSVDCRGLGVRGPAGAQPRNRTRALHDAVQDPRAAGIPPRVCGHHAAERRERRPARGGRFHARRRYRASASSTAPGTTWRGTNETSSPPTCASGSADVGSVGARAPGSRIRPAARAASRRGDAAPRSARRRRGRRLRSDRPPARAGDGEPGQEPDCGAGERGPDDGRDEPERIGRPAGGRRERHGREAEERHGHEVRERGEGGELVGHHARERERAERADRRRARRPSSGRRTEDSAGGSAAAAARISPDPNIAPNVSW